MQAAGQALMLSRGRIGLLRHTFKAMARMIQSFSALYNRILEQPALIAKINLVAEVAQETPEDVLSHIASALAPMFEVPSSDGIESCDGSSSRTPLRDSKGQR